MKRRNAIKGITIAAGAGLLMPTFAGCGSEDYTPLFFSYEDLRLINEVANTVLPATSDTPGAGETRVANFIDVYVNDCYTLDQQESVSAGLVTLQARAKEAHSKKFERLDASAKTSFLIELDQETKSSMEPHYFSLLKSLILFGYFTSQEGMETALNYLPIPGKYVGDYPIASDGHAWAL